MTKRNYVIGAVCILAIFAGYFIFSQKQADYPPPQTGKNIIIFGDSLAAGQGSTPGHDLASVIAQKTGLPTINAGRNGDTALSALPRLPQVLAENPRVVIILLGGNDFLQRVPQQQTMDSITQILDQILQTGSGVILINENKIFGTTSLFRKLAEDKKIPYIEDGLGGIIKKKEWMSDQIHPNDLGYAELADKIIPVLQDYLQ